MDESQVFELPKASEKLSYKFILDALLKERLLNESSRPAEESQSQQSENSEPSEPLPILAIGGPADEEVCGTLATPQIALPPEPVLESGEDAADAQMPEPYEVPELEPGKKYFRIGEVAQFLKVETYVIRYWESEFKNIRPIKSNSGHRVYTRKDVELLRQIRHLLYSEKFSIKGAKKQLMEKKRQPIPALALQKSQRNQQLLKSLVQELKELIQLARTTNPGVM